MAWVETFEYVDAGENGIQWCEFWVEERDAYEWEENRTYEYVNGYLRYSENWDYIQKKHVC